MLKIHIGVNEAFVIKKHVKKFSTIELPIWQCWIWHYGK